jgi:hypothetical protein
MVRVGIRGTRIVGVAFAIFVLHFFQYDWVPAVAAIVGGDVIFTCPAPHPKFLDEVDFRLRSAEHDPPFANRFVERCQTLLRV